MAVDILPTSWNFLVRRLETGTDLKSQQIVIWLDSAGQYFVGCCEYVRFVISRLWDAASDGKCKARRFRVY